MRAALITGPGGPEVLQVREVDDPVPSPDEVLGRCKGIGPEPGRSAAAPWRLRPAAGGAGRRARSGVFPGWCWEAGERVTAMAPGDRVFGLLAAEQGTRAG